MGAREIRVLSIARGRPRCFGASLTVFGRSMRKGDVEATPPPSRYASRTMTNLNDEWRLRQPAAPHAPGHDRLVPGPQQNHANPWTDDSVDSETPTIGTGSPAAINLWLFLAKAFVVFLFS